MKRESMRSSRPRSSWFRCVTAIHGDRLEHLAAQRLKEWDTHAKAITGLTAGCGSDKTIARINTMLHLDQEEASGLRPGNIYRVSPEQTKTLGLRGGQFYSDFLEKPDAAKIRALAARRLCCPVLVEVTPACDHAQGKVRVPRCVAGIIVQDELSKKLKLKKKAGFMWVLGPLYLSKGVKEGVYYLRLSARYVFGIASSQLDKNRNWGRCFRIILAPFSNRTARDGRRCCLRYRGIP